MRSSKNVNLSDRKFRSIWKEQSAEFWSFFCPLCSAPRKIAGSPRPGVKHAFQIVLTSLVFTALAWNWFAWRGIVSLVPFWVVFEMVFRSRVRAQVYCSKCGFDPFLFAHDEKLAQHEVENHWRKIYAEKGIPFPEKKNKIPKNHL